MKQEDKPAQKKDLRGTINQLKEEAKSSVWEMSTDKMSEMFSKPVSLTDSKKKTQTKKAPTKTNPVGKGRGSQNQNMTKK